MSNVSQFFPIGVKSVQHFQATANPPITDVTISSVNISKSVVIVTGTRFSVPGSIDMASLPTVRLISSTSVRLERPNLGGYANPIVSFQVVEFY